MERYYCKKCGYGMFVNRELCGECQLKEDADNVWNLSRVQLNEKYEEIIQKIKQDKSINNVENELIGLIGNAKYIKPELQEVLADLDIFDIPEVFYNASANVQNKLIQKNKANILKELSNGTYECFALEKSQNPVACIRLDEKCPTCGSDMVNILSIDGKDERFKFLNLKDRICVKACVNCLPYMDVAYCEYDTDGNAKCINKLENEEYIYEIEPDQNFPNEGLGIYKQMSPLNARLVSAFSSLGGVCKDERDVEVCSCPKCSKKMKFLANIKLGDVLEYHGGECQAFVCEDCNIGATTYFQT